MRRASLLLSMSVILVLLLAACGGGDAPAATSAPAPATDAPAAPPAAPEGYQGGAVSDGGSISGTVTAADSVSETIEVDKDTEVCGDSIDVATVEVDSSGGLSSVVVRITDITSGKPLNSLGSSFVLDQKGCIYGPNVVIAPVGSALTVLNSDGILHNIHTTPFDNAPLNVAQPGTQAELMSPEFTVAEFIPVGCDVHTWMNATVAVVDNPYAVVTGADGSFTLDDVPAGTYTLEFWHAELGTQTQTVTVEAGATVTADAGF